MSIVQNELSRQIDDYNEKYGYSPKYIVIGCNKLEMLKLECVNWSDIVFKEVQIFEGIPIVIKEDCVIM